MKISEMTESELAQRLIITVINYNDSKERLYNFPHIHKGSFAILAQLCVGEKNINGQYTACITVTNDMLNGWGMEPEELFAYAKDNSKGLLPANAVSISSFLDNANHNFLEGAFNIDRVLVISNDSCYNGSAAIFYAPDILDKAVEKLESKKIYLLPSSVNHMYCVPSNNGISVDELNSIFAEMTGAIENNSRVCDSILAYDSETRTITETNGESYDLTLESKKKNTINKCR
jgi:hypothetical protein